MRRREAIGAILALGAMGAPFRPAGAQKPARSRVLGYLSLEASPSPYPTPEQWRQRSLSLLLRKTGWDEGVNLRVERAYAELQPERLEPLAQALIAMDVEVIIANGPEASVAAARATKTIPIVSFNLVWPEEQGLIDSYARPGRNVTGVSLYPGAEASTKRMELLREFAPAARRLSWLWPADYQRTVGGGAFDMAPTFQAIAKGLGFELRFHPLRRSEDLEPAFSEIAAWPAHALMASSEYVVQARRGVAEFALRQRLPSACPSAEVVEAGGLFSYAPGRSELFRLYDRTFEYVDRILRGARAADLPVERPNRYELVINARTAKALGLKIPQAVLLRADGLIE